MNTLPLVLIVEDDLSLKRALEEKFAFMKLRTISAADGQEGLNLALVSKPDIIVLDIMMPVKDGVAMMDDLRKHDAWGNSVPIILLSNLNPTDALLNKVSEDHPTYYLIKDEVKIQEVVDKVMDILNEKKAESLQ